MEEKNKDDENVEFLSLENSDNEESARQMRWTIIALVVGLGSIVLFYLFS